MKVVLALLTLLLASSCEYASLKYGYYWNPIKVLEEAHESLETNNLSQLTAVLTDKALCSYGSREGLNNLKGSLAKVDESSVQEPVLVSEKYLSKPQYVGYYSYFQQKYVSRALDKYGHTLFKVTILCNMGSPDFSQKLVNAPFHQYETKSCSIVAIANLDHPLETPSVCENL